MQGLGTSRHRAGGRDGMFATGFLGAALVVFATSWASTGQPLKALEQKRIDDAIDRGIAVLRRSQNPKGFFGNTVPLKSRRESYPVGFAALPGLALLECGVGAKDEEIQKAARFVRQKIPTLNGTYEISLAILFLDRLGDADDRTLIRALALRLAAGQTNLGGWHYRCPLLSASEEKELLKTLGKQPVKDQKPLPTPNPKVRDSADNSNTQFAILGLWTARKHDVPLDYILARVEQRFRSSQQPGGWSYRYGWPRPYGSMTCVGLLGLAVGRGSAFPQGLDAPKSEDMGIAEGLRALGAYLKDPSDARGLDSFLGPKGSINLYFLWSVERVAVLCNLKTIGGQDWYRWGVDLLLPTQRKDGSWLGRGNGGSPVIDTSMALLFLKRSDLLPDLREALQKRVKITDPGLEKAISPGEKPDPKKGTKSPAEKGHDTGKKLELKSGIPKKVHRGRLDLSQSPQEPKQDILQNVFPFDKSAQRGKAAEHDAYQLFQPVMNQAKQFFPGGIVADMNLAEQALNFLVGGDKFHHHVVLIGASPH